jgi:hypothetical protein
MSPLCKDPALEMEVNFDHEINWKYEAKKVYETELIPSILPNSLNAKRQLGTVCLRVSVK